MQHVSEPCEPEVPQTQVNTSILVWIDGRMAKTMRSACIILRACLV